LAKRAEDRALKAAKSEEHATIKKKFADLIAKIDSERVSMQQKADAYANAKSQA